MLRKTAVALLIAAALAGCHRGAPDAGKQVAAQPVLVAPEDVLTVRATALLSGPVITGSIQPERRADLRAEVASVVMNVLKQNGDVVKRGDLLLRLDDTSIRDALLSADAAVRAASLAYDQASRQLDRFKTLRQSGMVSLQQLEDTEVKRNSAQSDLAAARARSVQARQQLDRTEVRAPFDGVVSDRQVSAGDTVQIGKELMKVIDPASMRFEGFVTADRIGNVRVGQEVVFTVSGADNQQFTGKVTRIDPSADPTTRQVAVFVGFDGQKQTRVAGLYAEGHIDTGSAQALTVPESALAREGDKAYAWRIANGTLQKTALVLGDRDPRHGDFVVKSGLSNGDRILRDPGSSLKDGEKVTMVNPGAGMAAPGVVKSSAVIQGK